MAKEKGAKITNGCNINFKTIIKGLEDEKLVIVAGQTGLHLHAILICGYNKDKFIVCDPLFKEKQAKSYLEIEKFMNTSIGKWCIIVGKKMS